MVPPLGESDKAATSSSSTSSSSSFSKCEKKQQQQQKQQSTIIASLRNEICQLQVKCDEFEQERNYTNIKLGELTDVINAYKNSENPDNDDDEHNCLHIVIMQKAMKVSEMKYEIQQLKVTIKTLEEENMKLTEQYEEQQFKNLQLSTLIKSLQQYNNNDYRNDEKEEKEEEGDQLMTPERALDMTLRNMKRHIESLEEERQKLANKCQSQSGFIESLQKEKDNANGKLRMMEDFINKLKQPKNAQQICLDVTLGREDEPPSPTNKEGDGGTAPRVALSKAAEPNNDDGEDNYEKEEKEESNVATFEAEEEARNIRRRARRLLRSGSGSDLMAQEHRRTARAGMGMSRSDSSSNINSSANNSQGGREPRRRFRRSGSSGNLEVDDDTTSKALLDKASKYGLSLSSTSPSTATPHTPSSSTRRFRRSISAKSLNDMESSEDIDSSTHSIDFDPNKAKRMDIVVGGQDAIYTGPLENGVPNGTGTIRFKNGDTYLGELVNGEMHGQGTLYHHEKAKGLSRGRFQHNQYKG